MTPPALRLVSSSPKTDDFTPLHEHQAQTPETFFGGKPVLYANQNGLTLSALASRLAAEPVFSKLVALPGELTDNVCIPDVELWATSEELILFQHTPDHIGVAIPWPSIPLQGTQKLKSTVEDGLLVDALLINVSCNDVDVINDESDIQTLEVTVLPPDHLTPTPNNACIKDIYAALNTCAELHPDPNSSEAEDENMEEDLSAPGASGWITADNMHEYLDENGNFREGMQVIGGPQALGPGSGTVRPREEADEENLNGVNGVDDVGHETKYHRVG